MTSDTGYVGTPPSRISPSKMPTAYLLVPPRRGLWGPPVSPAIKRRFSTVHNRGTRYTSRPRRLDAENLAGEETTGGLSRVDIQGCTRVETNVCRGLIVTNLRDRVYHVIVKLEGRTIMRAAWRNDLGYCANPSRTSLATEFRTRLLRFRPDLLFFVCSLYRLFFCYQLLFVTNSFIGHWSIIIDWKLEGWREFFHNFNIDLRILLELKIYVIVNCDCCETIKRWCI